HKRGVVGGDVGGGTEIKVGGDRAEGLEEVKGAFHCAGTGGGFGAGEGGLDAVEVPTDVGVLAFAGEVRLGGGAGDSAGFGPWSGGAGAGKELIADENKMGVGAGRARRPGGDVEFGATQGGVENHSVGGKEISREIESAIEDKRREVRGG